jgi:hypothetical protein
MIIYLPHLLLMYLSLMNTEIRILKTLQEAICTFSDPEHARASRLRDVADGVIG